MVEIAQASGARTVLTYHTPTMSCARGDMMEFGASPCDGRLDRQRCVACVLSARGLPHVLATAASLIPAPSLAALAGFDAMPRGLSGARVPGLIHSAQESFRQMVATVDRIVAVCDWVRSVLLINGLDPAKIVMSRQGISDDALPIPARAGIAENGPLRCVYFGRLDPVKGIDLIIQALRFEPHLDIALDLFVVRQHGADMAYKQLCDACAEDARITLRTAVPARDVQATMATYDLVIVPSRWLETGPLVVLEAFAAGVPVVGADLGGIAELVRGDVDGLLFEPGDARALVTCLSRLCQDRKLLARLTQNVQPPRRMQSVANDMAQLYRELLGVDARNPDMRDRPRSLPPAVK